MASDGTTSGPIGFTTPKLCKIGGVYTFPQKCLPGLQLLKVQPVYECVGADCRVPWAVRQLMCQVIGPVTHKKSAIAEKACVFLVNFDHGVVENPVLDTNNVVVP